MLRQAQHERGAASPFAFGNCSLGELDSEDPLSVSLPRRGRDWIPAFAGMTVWWRGIGDGQPQGLPLRWVGRGLFWELYTKVTNWPLN